MSGFKLIGGGSVETPGRCLVALVVRPVFGGQSREELNRRMGVRTGLLGTADQWHQSQNWIRASNLSGRARTYGGADLL